MERSATAGREYVPTLVARHLSDEDWLAEMATIADYCWRRDGRSVRWHQRAALEEA